MRKIKGYKQFVFILVLVLVLLPAASPARAEDSEVTIEPLVVTATRTPTRADHLAANIFVVTRQRIEETPAQNAAEVLAGTPGLFMDFIGGRGSQATPSIYGSDTRHVLVLIDGVPQNLLSNPIADLSKIPVNRIERIEVYKGSASSAWGSALGGVINIITRRAKTNKMISGKVAAGYGDFNATWLQADISGRLDGVGYFLTGRRMLTDGVDPHREFKQSSIYLKIDRDLGTDASCWLSVNHDESFKADPALLVPGYWESGKVKRDYQTFHFEKRFGEQFEAGLQVRRQEVSIKQAFRSSRQPDMSLYTYLEETWGISGQAAFDNLSGEEFGHILSFGFDLEWGEYDFSREPKASQTRNQSFRVSEIIGLGRVSLNAGLRFDDNKDFGSELSPAAGVVVRLDPLPARLRFQWERGFSAPPPSYLFDPRAGNPNLKPEKADTWQVGADVAPSDRVRVSATYFHGEVEDLIVYDPLEGRMVNRDRVRRTAFELEGRLHCGKSLTFQGGATFVDVVDTRLNEPVREIPSSYYDVGLTHRFRGLVQSLSGRWLDYNSSRTDVRDKRFIWNYQVRYALTNRWTVTAAVYNLGNTEEYQYSSLPHPGRRSEISLSFTF